MVITDDEDKGSVQFERPVYYTNEQVGTLPVAIVRTGDLDTPVSVACLTRPMSARDHEDFSPLGMGNRVTFQPGQDRATCNVRIIDDRQPEGQEEFELILEQPDGSQLGVINRARVIIQEPHVGKSSGETTWKENYYPSKEVLAENFAACITLHSIDWLIMDLFWWFFT